MEATKTVVCKLKTTEEEFEKLFKTAVKFRDACNYVSEVAWNNRCFNPVALHHLTYYEVREKFNLTANLAIRARDRVAKTYKTNRKKQHKFKQLSIDLDKRLFTLLRNGEFRVSIATIEGRVKPPLDIGDYQRELLKNETRDAKLIYRKKDNRFYIHITVKYEVPDPKGDNPVGVDVGINNLLVASNGFTVKGGEVKHRRRHFAKLRRSLQKKGTSSARRKLKQLSGRERRWVNNALHTISKRFVESLKKGDYVVMEKLNGIRDKAKINKNYRYTFHSWAFRKLKEMITYKCIDRGIPVVEVDAFYTSQRCPRCGTIDKRNRSSKYRNLFRCVSCGYQHNADYVASVNLSELARGGWAPVNVPNVGMNARHDDSPTSPFR